jgi:type VI secretion system VasD/TssJ family lipoprotein
MSKSLFNLFLLVVVGTSVAACGGVRNLFGRGGASTTVQVTGAPDLNSGGNAAFVHIYLLTDNAMFRTASYEAFWQSPQEALGESMRSSSQVQLFPGTKESVELELQTDIRYVGVAANLRAPDRDRWRAVFPASDVEGNVLHVVVDANSLSAQVQE